eukprot:GHRR01021301.1.p2 GENE.GHRR01021301.1~~GHRR01021301.1.p2  ORF type:complete len:110 (-),score=8.23 GHRR01021301.1:465-794(-)
MPVYAAAQLNLQVAVSIFPACTLISKKYYVVATILNSPAVDMLALVTRRQNPLLLVSFVTNFWHPQSATPLHKYPWKLPLVCTPRCKRAAGMLLACSVACLRHNCIPST